MSNGVEFSWQNLAEASEEATRKFTWISAGLAIACAILAYMSISAYVRYSQTCEYIGEHAPSVAGQQSEESDFAQALLQKYCG